MPRDLWEVNGDDPTFEEASAYIIPFGKHKGERVEDVPLRYLDWAIGEWDAGRPVTRAIAVYLKHPSIARQIDFDLDD